MLKSILGFAITMASWANWGLEVGRQYQSYYNNFDRGQQPLMRNVDRENRALDMNVQYIGSDRTYSGYG